MRAHLAGGVLVLGLAFAAPAAPAQPAEAALSAAQAREEIALATRVVTRLHPGAFRHLGRDGFDELSAGLGARIAGPQSRRQMLVHLSRILGAVCDEHTQVHDFDIDTLIAVASGAPAESGAAQELQEAAGLAANLLLLDGRLLVAPGSGELPTGGEIVSIDGRPAGELVDLLVERLPIDGCAAGRKVTVVGIAGQEILGALLGPGPTYEVAVRPPGGEETESHQVRAISAGEMLPSEHGDAAASPAKLAELGFSKVVAEDGLLLAYDDRRRIAYLAIDSFFETSNAAIRRTMRRLLGLGARHLLVDLQGNTGGRVDAMRRAVSFLLPTAHRFANVYELRTTRLPEPAYFSFAKGKERQFARDVRQFARGRRDGDLIILPGGLRAYGNPHFPGKVTVLVNALTGSAAAVAAFILKKERGAVLVGTETHAGAAYTCGRALGSYQMPYSGLRLYIPHACARRTGALAKAYARTIVPDIEVLPRPEALDEHRLDVLKAALARIGQAG